MYPYQKNSRDQLRFGSEKVVGSRSEKIKKNIFEIVLNHKNISISVQYFLQQKCFKAKLADCFYENGFASAAIWFFFFLVIYKKSQVRIFYIFLFQTRLMPFYQELYFTIQNAQHASTFTFGQQLRVIIASFRREVIPWQTFPQRNILLANETDLMP